jgi:hypothetical protein
VTLIRTLTAIATLALCMAPRAHAQGDHSGRIEGAVTDSVHARPLAGAHVVAVGAGPQSEVRREATSDSAGVYHIDPLPPGQYIVGFESALLDSLEVTLSPRQVTVAPGQVATLDLALPPAAKLRSAVCLGATLPAGMGVIYGHVVSAESESPLAGVAIAMVSRDLTVERTNRVRAISREWSDSVITDRDGWYRMCGVPTGAWVSMQIRQNNRSGSILRTRVDDTLGIAIQHLSLSTTGETIAGGQASAPRSGTATLTGVVRSTAGVPVASAEVRVRDTRAETRTDAQGAFSLSALPAGTQQLEVRRIGYAVVEAPVALRSGATVTHDVVLRRIVNLDSVIVVASRPKYPEFYANKSAGWGRFLGPEEIMKQRVSRTSDIIEKLPGFAIEQRGYRSVVVSIAPMSIGSCTSSLVINGARVLENPPAINDVHPAEIGAIEVYRWADPSPPEYGPNPCGVIAIWTKR